VHELTLAESILDMVGAKVPAGTVLRCVHVKLGPLSGVNAESLAFGFESLAPHRGFPHAKLDIDRTPVRARCGGCGLEYESENPRDTCPRCGALERTVVSGNEFFVESIEVEE
jgi:hydrogenase nickel incorporation protein HypA/HybF